MKKIVELEIEDYSGKTEEELIEIMEEVGVKLALKIMNMQNGDMSVVKQVCSHMLELEEISNMDI